MIRPLGLAALAVAALAACGGEAPTPAAPHRAVAERPAGTIVYVSGSNRLTSIDVASGRRRVRTMPAVAQCGPQLHVTGGHVVFAGLQRGRTTVFAVPLALDRRPVRLGAAHAYVPSATDGRVWLAGVDCDRPALTGVREVTVGGRVTAESSRRVPGTWLEAATRDGLVILRGRALHVWDPRTGRTIRRLGLAAVTESRGDLLVGCTARCRQLAIVSGRGTVVAKRRLDAGTALSPAATLVAAPALRGRRWTVAMVDTRTGAATTVPGTRSGTYPQLAWARSSGWLFIRGRGGRVLAYRPGQPRAVRLPLRLPREAADFTAG